MARRTSVLNKVDGSSERGRGVDALFEPTQLPVRKVEEIDALKIVELPLSALRENPRQPRQDMDQASLEDLVSSIRDTGVQDPIKARPAEGHEDAYYVITGHRRVEASRRAGLQTVPARIVNVVDDLTERIIMLDENAMREDLSVVDKAAAILAITDQLPHGEKQGFYERYKITRAQIHKWRQLLELSEEVKDDVRRGVYTERHARAFWKLPPTAQDILRSHLVEDRPTSDQASKLGREILAALYSQFGDEYYDAPAQDVAKLTEETLSLHQAQEGSPQQRKRHRANVSGIQRLHNLHRSLSLISWEEVQGDRRHINPVLEDIMLTSLKLRRQAGNADITPNELEATRTRVKELAEEANNWLKELGQT